MPGCVPPGKRAGRAYSADGRPPNGTWLLECPPLYNAATLPKDMARQLMLPLGGHEQPPRQWAHQDSNLGPTGYEPGALPLSYGPVGGSG